MTVGTDAAPDDAAQIGIGVASHGFGQIGGDDAGQQRVIEEGLPLDLVSVAAPEQPRSCANRLPSASDALSEGIVSDTSGSP